MSSPITFSEYPVGTAISTQYANVGILFSGSQGPRIADDSSSPTSPVLSPGAGFLGDIEGDFTIPGSTETGAVNSVAFDLGYIDTAGTTAVDFYGPFNQLLGTQVINTTGIVHITWNQPDTVRFVVRIITDDPDGWAIDNVSFSPAYVTAGSRDWTQSLGPGNAGQNPQNCNSGDPVSCASGNLWESNTDFSIPGRGRALSLQRTYNALDAASATAAGRFGYGWSDSYGAHLTFGAFGVSGFVTVVQGDGSRLEFWPQTGGGYQTSAWTTAKLVQNADGTYTVTYRDQTSDTYNASGQLISETDRNGYLTTMTYSGSNLTSVTDPSGRTITFTYNPDGTVATAVDPMGHTVSYGYDSNQNLISVTDATGAVTRYAYDASHDLTSMTNPNGGVTTNTFDAQHRVITQVDPAGRSTSYAYSGVENYGAGPAGTTIVTDPLGRQRESVFDGMGDLLSKTLAYGTSQAETWTYTYDPNTGNRLSATDPNGHTQTYAWDANSNLLSTTDGANETTARTYDALNDVTSVTDPLGNLVTYGYNANGDLTTITSQLNTTGQYAVTTYTYGDTAHPGDVTKVSDPAGRVHTLAYDDAGDLTDITDGLGDHTHQAFNADGLLTSSTSPRGTVPGATAANFTTSYTYNKRGQTTAVNAPTGQSTQYQYDAQGNRTATTDGKGNTTRYTYDADNELTAVTQPNNSTQVTTYDADGEVTAQTDGLGKTTTYGYNSLGQRINSTDPLNRTTAYGYDPAGNQITVTDPLNRVTTYGYDAANRVTSITYSDGVTPNVTYGYDADGQRTSMTDGTGTTNWTYDSLHRLTAETSSRPLTGLAYGYDLDGNVTELIYPGGTDTVTKTYDAANRMASVTDAMGNTTKFGYDPDGDLTTINYANGITSNRTYNAADQVTLINDTTPPSGTTGTGTDLLNLPYTRDNDGLVATQNTTAVPTVTTSGLDPANTLVTPESIQRDGENQVSGANLSATNTPLETYTYDAGNNLTTRTIAGALTDSLTYDAAHELTGISNTATKQTFTYDALGERTSSTTTGLLGVVKAQSAYGYDQAGDLTSYAGPPIQALNDVAGTKEAINYTYDGLGRRSDLTWDMAEGTTPLIVGDGLNTFITGPGGMVVEQLVLSTSINSTQIGVPLYLESDQLGSTRVVTDSHATPLIAFTYDAYGRTTLTPLAKLSGLGLTAAVTPIQYAGAYTDLKTGLIYMRARWYDPTTADFLTTDPLQSITRQPYNYANNNPIDYTDPTGLDWWNPLSWSTSTWTDIGIGLVIGGAGIASGGILLGAGYGALLYGVGVESAVDSVSAGLVISGGLISGGGGLFVLTPAGLYAALNPPDPC